MTRLDPLTKSLLAALTLGVWTLAFRSTPSNTAFGQDRKSVV